MHKGTCMVACMVHMHVGWSNSVDICPTLERKIHKLPDFHPLPAWKTFKSHFFHFKQRERTFRFVLRSKSICRPMYHIYTRCLIYLNNHPGKGGCENGCVLVKNVPAQLRDTNHTHDTLIPRTHIHASIPTFSAVYTGSRLCTHEVTQIAF